jgi:glutathione S-transferase
MVLTLYHAEPLANSLKVLMALHEKELPFESRYVNLQKFEQNEPAFLAINPEGQVPVLDTTDTR